MNQRQHELITLVRSAILSRKEILSENFSLEELLPMIKMHQIAAVALTGLVNCGGDLSSESGKKLLQMSCHAISVSESQTEGAKALFEEFEQAKIDYLPLKGVVLKNLYPDSSLRPMVDVDVLIRLEQYERIVPIMRKLGYEEGTESDHEYNWRKGNVHIELHKRLIPSYNKDLYAYFGEGWGKAQAQQGSRYALSDEDCFIYLFCHYAKHFQDGGVGIKHLLDIWFYRKQKPDMDEMYITEELRKVRLYDFYQHVLQTVSYWFEDGELTEPVEIICNTVMGAGAFGSESTRQKARELHISPKKTHFIKLRWYLHLVFLPYKNMCQKYPFLKKAAIALPVMWVYRLIVTLLKPSKIKKQAQLSNAVSVQEVNKYRDELSRLGLNLE